MKIFMTTHVSLILFLCACLGGCESNTTQSPPQSAIVSAVQNAGAGSLRGADEAAIAAWLNSHTDVAKRIAGPCKAVGQGASADWARTTEGVVCAADAQIMFTLPTNLYKPY